MTQNTDVTLLANTIVKKFIDSMPQIVTEWNNQNKRNGSIGNSGSNYQRGSRSNKHIHDDKNLVERLKRERDVTQILQQQLKLRAHELKVLRQVNDQYIKIVKIQGTYNNQTLRASETLLQTLDNSSKQVFSFFKKIDDFSYKTSSLSQSVKKINEEAKKLQGQVNSGSIGSEEAKMRLNEFKRMILEPLNKQMDETIKYTKKEFEATSPHRKQILDTVSSIKKITAELKSTNLTDFITKIDNVSNGFDTISTNIDSHFDPINSSRKQASYIERIIIPEIERNLQQISHLSETMGDIFGEDDRKRQQILDKNTTELQHQLEKWEKIIRQTPERAQEFLDELQNTVDGLRDESSTMVSMLSDRKLGFKHRLKLFFDDILRYAKTGKNREGEDTKSGFMEALQTLLNGSTKLPWIAALASGLRLLVKGLGVGVELFNEIAEDQRVVQKFGVNMTNDKGFSVFRNFQDSIGTGLTNTQLAEWKFQNRRTNLALGGERAGVDQFRRFMMMPTDNPIDTKAISDLKQRKDFIYNGQKISFGELIGGDSDYQAETYDAITNSLLKMGVIPTDEAIEKILTNSNGLMDMAYKTGQLPKELMQFYGELTDGIYANAEIAKSGTDLFINSVNEFQLMGISLGANTEATKQLTKSILENAKGDAPTQIKKQIMAQHMARIMGLDEGSSKLFSAAMGATGQQKISLLTQLFKNPGVQDKFIKMNYDLSHVYDPEKGSITPSGHKAMIFDKLLAASELSSEYSELVNMATMIDQRRQLGNPQDANNKLLNPDFSHFAQTAHKLQPILNQKTSMFLAGTNYLGDIYNDLSNAAKNASNSLNDFATTLGTFVGAPNAKLERFKFNTNTFNPVTDYPIRELSSGAVAIDFQKMVNKVKSNSDTEYSSKQQMNKIVANTMQFLEMQRPRLQEAVKNRDNDNLREATRSEYGNVAIEMNQSIVTKLSEIADLLKHLEKIPDVEKQKALNMINTKAYEIGVRGGSINNNSTYLVPTVGSNKQK